MARFRPVAMLVGMPFASICSTLSLIGAVIWVVGKLVSLIFPCWECMGLINRAVYLIRLPVVTIRYFLNKIPF
ncbi:hypothetical protein AB3S75_017231 [Citrus x aurantiifolia]